MTLLSRKVDYALLILSYLFKEAGKPVSAREVAAHFALSQSFSTLILKDLCHGGFVTSFRGWQGGYKLQRPAEEMRLADLMDALDDTFHLTECTKHASEDDCSLLNICPLKHALGVVHQRIREVLRNVTLAELFKPAASTGQTQFGLIVSPLVEKQLVTQ